MQFVNTKLLSPQPIVIIGIVTLITHIAFKNFYNSLGSNNNG